MSTFQAFWEDQFAAGDPSEYQYQYMWTAKRIGLNSWTAKTLHYDMRTHPPPNFNSSNDFIDGIIQGINVEVQAKTTPQAVLLSLTQNSDASEQLFAVPGNVTPVVVNNTHQPASWDTFTISQGPYEYPSSSGSYWVIGNMTFAYGPALLVMAVFNSTNYNPTTGVGTWNRMDVAHEPANIVAFDGQFDGSNDFLRFLTNAGGSNYDMIEFNMITGLYTTPHDSVTLDTPVNIGGMIYSSSVGKTGVFYGDVTAANLKKYAYFDGSWHTGITAVNLVPVFGFRTFILVLLDPNGTRLHTFYKQTNHCRYQQIDITGTLGPDFDLGINSGFTAQGCPGHSAIFTDASDGIAKIGLLVDWDPIGDGRLSPACFMGWPLSNPDFNAEGLLTNPLGPGNPGPEVIDTYAGDRATCTYGYLVNSSLDVTGVEDFEIADTNSIAIVAGPGPNPPPQPGQPPTECPLN